MITLLYFARLREALGTGQEQLALPAGVLKPRTESESS